MCSIINNECIICRTADATKYDQSITLSQARTKRSIQCKSGDNGADEYLYQAGNQVVCWSIDMILDDIEFYFPDSDGYMQGRC